MTTKARVEILVRSPPETRNWLELIITGVATNTSQLEYVKSQFWGTFRNSATRRNVVYVQPTRKQIRLHMHLPLSYDDNLEATSASKHWAKTCPSLFRVKSEADIEKAISLITGAYQFDLSRNR